MTQIPAIEIHDLTVSFDKRPVLWNVDVSLPAGEMIGVMGPNGAGKSTLIRAVMGLAPIESGWVKILGKPLSEQRRLVGYVPQRESVDWDFPVTVADVVLMGTYARCGWFGRPGAREREIAAESLARCDLSDLSQRQISELSGGQRQRVFLSRALAQQADVYLLDEPFVGIDAVTQSQIVELLQSLRAAGKTIVVVHHDLQTASEYFTRVLLLNLRLIAFGTPDEVLTRERLRQAYGGRMSILADAADLWAESRR
jgi:manganese/zinc/iron transport system ATP- binding protein